MSYVVVHYISIIGSISSGKLFRRYPKEAKKCENDDTSWLAEVLCIYDPMWLARVVMWPRAFWVPNETVDWRCGFVVAHSITPYCMNCHKVPEMHSQHTCSFRKLASTVECVLKDHPIGHKNVVSQDRWFLVTGSVILKVGPSAKNVWSLKTGGLSWQWSLKTGFTVLDANFHLFLVLSDNMLLKVAPMHKALLTNVASHVIFPFMSHHVFSMTGFTRKVFPTQRALV